MKKYRIAYVVSDLKRVGPSNQTLNIITNSKYRDESVVITLFEEPTDTMIDEYKANNIDVICLNLGRVAFIFNGKNKLKKVLKDLSIKIIHSYGIKPDSVCQKVSRTLNIPHIITLRNYPKEDILTRMNFIKGYIALSNHLKVLKKAKYIVACSKTIERKMKKDYPSMNIVAIQNGVNTDKYKAVDLESKKELRKKYDVPSDSIIYISTSSFIPRKRIDETIEGFLKANVDNSMLLLLGGGMLFDEIKNKYGNIDKIKFVGKTPNVADYLNLSDVFISTSESEGLPNGVIEAIATGIPVILSNIPQHEEIIEEVLNAGICYELGNVEALAAVIRDNNIIKMRGDITKSPFTMKNMSNKYVEYYDKFIK